VDTGIPKRGRPRRRSRVQEFTCRCGPASLHSIAGVTAVNAAHRFASLRGDIAGAIACAILTLPGSAGVGVIALAPLGDQYVAHGGVAGLYPALFLSLIAVLLGARSPMLYSPRSVLAVLIGSIVAGTLIGGSVVDPADMRRTEAVLFLVVFGAGL